LEAPLTSLEAEVDLRVRLTGGVSLGQVGVGAVADAAIVERRAAREGMRNVRTLQAAAGGQRCRPIVMTRR
jgi:hypothetical protein